MKSLAALILLTSLLVAQTETPLQREISTNSAWERHALRAKVARGKAEKKRAELEKLFLAKADQFDELKPLYDGEDRPEAPEVIATVKTLDEDVERLENELDVAKEAAESAHATQTEASRETHRWEEDIDKLIAAAPKAERESWARVRSERGRISTAWLEAASDAVTDRDVAVVRLERILEVLGRTRSTHEVKNFLVRGKSPITWDSVKETVRDVPNLGTWISETARSIGHYVTAEHTRMGLFRWGGVALIAVMATLWLGIRLRNYSLKLEATEMEEPQQRVFRTSARLLRRGLHFALLYVVPWSASKILPGLTPEAAKFLERMGFLFALLYIVWSFYWELLRPRAANHAIVEPDPHTRRRVTIAIYFILGWSLLLEPLRIGMAIFDADHKYRGAYQITTALLLLGLAAALSGVIFRKRVMTQLVPAGDSGWARIARGSISLARPFLMLLMPALVVLRLLEFDLLADILTRSSLGLLAALAINLIIYQIAKVVIVHRTQRAYGDDATDPNTAGGATRAALIFGARLTCAWLVLTWGLQFANFTFYDLDLILSGSLPFLASDRTATWGHLLGAITIIIVVVPLTRHMRSLLQYQVLARLGFDGSTCYTITKLFGYAVLTVGILGAINMVFDLSDLSTIIAALAVGIGFGLQEIVANIVSGVTLLFERPVRIGDTIEVGPNRGLIRQINLRATTVQTLDNVYIHVPNRELMSQTVVNYGYDDPRVRLRIPVGVSYKSDPRVVRDLLLKVAEESERVLKYPSPQLQFVEFGNSSLNFELQPWIQRAEQARRIKSELNFAIFDALKEAGIEIPFPQQDLHIKTEPHSRVERPTSVEPSEDSPRED
jgi:small-conductance mechanosensitive channel